MSHRDVTAAERTLREALVTMMPAPADEAAAAVHESNMELLLEAIKGMAETMASEALDREFNRGDWSGY